MRGYYLHTGDDELWTYEVLEEFTFHKGKFVKTVDHSEIYIKRETEGMEMPNILHEAEMVDNKVGNSWTTMDE